MKSIVIGAGRIGRGFVTELLTHNGYEVVFFDANQQFIDLINEHEEYTIHVLGHEDKNTTVKLNTAYHITDVEALAKHWGEADYIFTAVGGKNVASLGEYVAKAFKLNQKEITEKKTNIITCENWIDPAKDLKEAVRKVLGNDFVAFEENVGVSEAVIMCTGTGAPDSSKQVNPLDTWVANMWYLPVDKDRLNGNPKPLEYISFIDDFGDFLKQKLYTNNTSVALIAFLGKAKGHRLVGDAANDPEIEAILDQVYDEINQALIKGMGIKEESQLKFAKRAKAKYQDKEIIDECSRIVRDPIRKLSRNDRLIGPAKIAMECGVKPKAISMAIAAALYYREETDPIAVELQNIRKDKGIDYILENICGLELTDPLVNLVYESIDDLKKRGWINE